MPEGMREFDRGIAPVKAAGGASGVSIAAFIGKPGAWSWTCPKDGKYAFRLWGPGGTNTINNGDGYAANGGSAGGYTRKTVKVSKGTVISGNVGGAGQANYTSPPTSTTATLPDGSVLTATGGTASGYNTIAAGGVGSGGDINLAGGTSNGGVGEGAFAGVSSGSNGGGSAPGDEIIPGGRGGAYLVGGTTTLAALDSNAGGFPGGGSGQVVNSSQSSGGYNPCWTMAARGLVLITYEGA